MMAAKVYVLVIVWLTLFLEDIEPALAIEILLQHTKSEAYSSSFTHEVHDRSAIVLQSLRNMGNVHARVISFLNPTMVSLQPSRLSYILYFASLLGIKKVGI